MEFPSRDSLFFMSSISFPNDDVFGRIVYFTLKKERAALFATCRRFRDLIWDINLSDKNRVFRYAKEPLLQTSFPFRVACNEAQRKISLLSNHVHDPKIEQILELFVIRVVKIKDYWNPRTIPNHMALVRENIYGLQLTNSKRDYFFGLNALLPHEEKWPEEMAPLPDQSVQILMNAYCKADSSSTHPAIKEAIALIDPAMTRSFRPLIDFYAHLGRKEITGLLLQNGADPNVEYFIEGTAGNWVPLIRVFESYLFFSQQPSMDAFEDYPGTLELLLKAKANIHKSTLWSSREGTEKVSLFSQLMKYLKLALNNETGFSADIPTVDCLVTTLTLLINHSTFPIDYNQILTLSNSQGATFMDLIAEHFPELHLLIHKRTQ